MSDHDNLRPADWSDYIGQERVKATLDVAINAARTQDRPLGHVFLAAPAGSGKTTLASLIAKRLGDPFEAFSLAGMTPRALTAKFRNCVGGVFLMDELQAATGTVQDQMNTLLEEHYITSPGGYRIDVGPWVTIVAATTEPERIKRAVRQKFEHQPRFDPYTDDEMRRIVQAMGIKVGIDVDYDTALALGRASAGVPRNARSLVYKARDLMVQNRRPAAAAEVLNLAGVAPDGLSEDHLSYLRALDRQMGCAGLATLQMMLSAHESEIRELERLLVGRGLIFFGDRGRELTREGAGRLDPERPQRRAA